VTVPVSGFRAVNTSVFVTVGSSPRILAGTTNGKGSAILSFRIPTGQAPGSQPVSIFEGTNALPTVQTSFTIGGTTPGPPGVANTIVTSSPLATYQVGISGINFWNGTTFPQPGET